MYLNKESAKFLFRDPEAEVVACWVACPAFVLCFTSHAYFARVTCGSPVGGELGVSQSLLF